MGIEEPRAKGGEAALDMSVRAAEWRRRRREAGWLQKWAHRWPLAVLMVVWLGVTGQPTTSAAAVPSPCPNAIYRTGFSATLPDCRAYEQVSPAEKENFAAISRNYPVQAMSNGEAFTYLSVTGAYSNPRSASFPDAYVAKRQAGGWDTINVAPPTPQATPPGGDEVSYVFSQDLTQLIVDVPLQQLAPEAPAGVYNLFFSSPDGTYTWVNDARPAVVPPEGCSAGMLVLCYQLVDHAVPAGTSADFHHVLFESNGSIAGAPEGAESLYESFNKRGRWHVRLVGILPDDKVAAGSTAGSGMRIFYGSFSPFFHNRVINAISEDGSRVIFQAPADGGEPDPAQNGLTEVYDRINRTETIELSAPAAGAKPANESPAAAKYWAASADGSRVFFTSKAELTTQSFTGAAPPGCGESEPGCDHGDLYEYDLETKTLKDLTIDESLPADEEQGAGVLGVIGASSDGSYVYFVATGQLVAGKGVDHADNLYMVHNGGVPVYIATLNGADALDWTEEGEKLEAYVTPDGRHLAFTSINSLKTVNFPGGYNNISQGEVYEYSAPTTAEEKEGLTGSIFCASCNPSGAPPIGPGLLGGVTRPLAPGPTDNSAFHQARAVSDNGGRVFFSSPDPLVPTVKGNTHPKVYEYERNGEGGCEVAAGCVYLLSSPTSTEEATFLDADSEGNNVFFATVSQLVSTDSDKLFDVYDARVGGGLASSLTEAPCRTSCREPVAKAPFASPLTASAGASGNLSPAHKTIESRAQKLAKALRACRKKKSKRKRRSCEARARKRYGPAKAHRSVHDGAGRER
jgi:hypothetical protein